MRIVQLIDSLNTGGAETIAVNFANALAGKIDFSGIIATRKQGNLLKKIENKDNYLFLNKKKATDFNAILKLKKYCKKNKIDFIHAHTTSFFTAFLLKIVYFKIKIIYHEHTGSRNFQTIYQNKLLWFCSYFFKAIIVVNQDLKTWCQLKLNCKNIDYLPNFVSAQIQYDKITKLEGLANKRILYLANLKNPKNHNLLLQVAIKLKQTHNDWSFHLVGTDYNDAYSDDLKLKIKNHNLQSNVFIYGLKNDITNIINQSEICIFTSDSEGLPVSFLEYGINSKPVISTKVGEIFKIIINNKNGIVVPVKDSDSFLYQLVKLIENEKLRQNLGQELRQTIINNYSKEIVVAKYLDWIAKI